MTRHYLDHASTAPLRPQARDAMIEALTSLPGDPSRIHTEGLEARSEVERAREQVAALLGARSREVVFTSGATESIAATVHGAAGRGDEQVVTAVEHSAVREATEQVGAVTVVPVDGVGRVDPEVTARAVGADTSVVHVQWGNHEVGTRQPVAEIVEACADGDALVHVDAAQAVGHVEVDFGATGVDLLSVSAHKFGGPAGVGALLVRRGLRLDPLLVGGDQERARRAGRENVAAIVGFGAACEAASAELDSAGPGQRALTDRALECMTALDGVRVYGDPVDRLPHLVCVGIDDIEPQAVLLGLDRRGIAAHSGSACSSESLEPSPVLEAMGVDAHRSLRISVGWDTSEADIDALAAALPDVLAELRALRPGA